MAVAVAKNVDFPGEAAVSLVGLPNKVTTDVKKITKDTKDLVFHLKTDAVSPAGNHTNLFCQVVVTQNDEPIVHNIGSGTCGSTPRSPSRPPPRPAPAARRRPAAPAAAPAKPLSRLEKLGSKASRSRGGAAAAGK